jgi:hypothetical protein
VWQTFACSRPSEFYHAKRELYYRHSLQPGTHNKNVVAALMYYFGGWSYTAGQHEHSCFWSRLTVYSI